LNHDFKSWQDWRLAKSEILGRTGIMTQFLCVARSRTDGQYLVARSESAEAGKPPDRYLLVFKEHADLLSYFNRHAPDLSVQFAMESVAQTQLPAILSRWSYQGIGLVEDPWIPTVKFSHLS
jgi:mitochondrial fission protein ELM1